MAAEVNILCDIKLFDTMEPRETAFSIRFTSIPTWNTPAPKVQSTL